MTSRRKAVKIFIELLGMAAVLAGLAKVAGAFLAYGYLPAPFVFDVGDTFDRLLEEVTLPLGRGDLFVLYTDGISEAMNEQGDCFGDQRLVELAERNADLKSDDLCQRILTEVHSFAGAAAQHDDMTMVLLKIEDH